MSELITARDWSSLKIEVGKGLNFPFCLNTFGAWFNQLQGELNLFPAHVETQLNDALSAVESGRDDALDELTAALSAAKTTVEETSVLVRFETETLRDKAAGHAGNAEESSQAATQTLSQVGNLMSQLEVLAADVRRAAAGDVIDDHTASDDRTFSSSYLVSRMDYQIAANGQELIAGCRYIVPAGATVTLSDAQVGATIRVMPPGSSWHPPARLEGGTSLVMGFDHLTLDVNMVIELTFKGAAGWEF